MLVEPAPSKLGVHSQFLREFAKDTEIPQVKIFKQKRSTEMSESPILSCAQKPFMTWNARRTNTAADTVCDTYNV